jgi:hypothetical protein
MQTPRAKVLYGTWVDLVESGLARAESCRVTPRCVHSADRLHCRFSRSTKAVANPDFDHISNRTNTGMDDSRVCMCLRVECKSFTLNSKFWGDMPGKLHFPTKTKCLGLKSTCKALRINGSQHSLYNMSGQ